MATFCSILLALAATNSSPVLLCFHSQECVPCRQMVPIVQRLEKMGYPTRHIDIQSEPHLAGQFRIEGVPAFVLLDGTREVDRVTGATSFARLEQMFKAPAKTNSVQSTRPPSKESRSATAANGSHRSAVVQRALEATVRIRVENSLDHAWGTGTIIDTHGDEALIVTCGHLFRESLGKGRISVESFAPGAKGPVPGQLIAFEAQDRDIALLSIRPGVNVKPVKVAAASYEAQPGEHVFSIGCDKGANPTVRTSSISAINKFLGAPNIEVGGQPVDGRSGGGLFDAEGQIIAVCNAADAEDNEGVYASWPNIHWQLAQVGLGGLFDSEDSDQPPIRSVDPIASRTVPPTMPTQMNEEAFSAVGAPDDDRIATVIPVSTRSTTIPDAEVTIVIRSKSNPNAQLQSFVIHEPTAALLQRLFAEGQRNEDQDRSRNPRTKPQLDPPLPARHAGQQGRIVRAQSNDN